jgi:hypothetical protein
MQLSTLVWFLLSLAEPRAIVVMDFSIVTIAESSKVQSCFSHNVKWRLVYVLSGHMLCSIIFLTRVLTVAPLISVIMVDYYFCEPHYQLYFKGYRPPRWMEETWSLCVFEDSSLFKSTLISSWQ